MGRLAQIPTLVLLLAVLHPSSVGQACSQSSPPPELGPTSDEVASALDRFQPEIEHQMQAQGFSLKSNWWDFKEQQGQVLKGTHLLKMTYVGGLDNRIDLHLLLSTIAGTAAVFPVGEGMVHDPKRAISGVQIGQYNFDAERCQSRVAKYGIRLAVHPAFVAHGGLGSNLRRCFE